MTLRKRTLVIIGATLVGLNTVLYSISSSLLLGSSITAEEQDTRQAMKGVLNVFAQNLEQFNDNFTDWAIWDDAYRFVQDGNQAFIESNLIEAQLKNLRISLILFIDTSGKVVFGTGFDAKNGRKTPIPEALKPHLVRGDRLLQHPTPTSSLQGIFTLPNGPMMIISRPILTSEAKGPIRGFLIVGRYLDSNEASRFARLTRQSVSLQAADQTHLPKGLNPSRSVAQEDSSILVQAVDSQTIAGYTLLNNIYDKPALLIRINNPRSIYRQGQTTVRFLSWSILGVGLVFGLVTLLLLEKMILARLSRLSQEVSGIGIGGDLSGRVSETGQDELSTLAGNINRMLAVLESYQKERQQAALDLQKARDSAIEASQAKSQFLANMSHELRTPLNAIIGYSEMLKEDAQELGQDNFIPDLDKIHYAGKHLLGVINDILDLSKIEAGKMDLYLETFDIKTAIAEIIATIQPLAQKNGNTLVVHCPAHIGTMHADLTKVRQNLFNLLSNASKFTEQGTISLSVAIQSTAIEEDGKETEENGHPLFLTPGSSPWLIFQVTDTGIGMTKAQMAQLFRAFTQADATTTRKYGGTGLGLAITKRFCQMMGGDIWVESKLGQGTCFTMVLPAMVIDPKTRAEESLRAISHSELEGISTVLVIDDDATIHDLMHRFLAKEGFRVASAMTAEDGLKMAKTLHPKAITLDVMMPSKDGWSLLAALKAEPEIATIPVIMITMVDDRSMGFALGATDYLTKPIDRDRLLATLKKCGC